VLSGITTELSKYHIIQKAEGDAFKVFNMKNNNKKTLTFLVYPAKLSFKHEGEIMTSQYKHQENLLVVYLPYKNY
jgi:hypothetical protein